MAPPPIPRELLAQAIQALQNAIDAGYLTKGLPSAHQKAAEALGLDHGTFRHRVRKALAAGFTLTEKAIQPEPAPEIHSIPKPRIRVQAYTRPEGKVYRIMGIGDAHDGPNLPDKSRFKWMARHAAATMPDAIVQIGDLFTFDSLNRFDKPGSLPQKTRPSFMLDIESGEEALSAFAKYCPSSIPKHVTLGNHCTRPLKYETGDASIEGALWPKVTDLLARYNWRWHDEGEFLFIGAVGFVHSPRTIRNKEFGGETMNGVANKACFSTVYGHTHRGQILHAPKYGPQGGVTLVNLGTCMPTGYVAEYAKVATTSWTYGIYDLVIQGGHITGHRFISMDELERLYGD